MYESEISSIQVPIFLNNYEQLEDILFSITKDSVNKAVEFIISNFHSSDFLQTYIYLERYIKIYPINIDIYMHIYQMLREKTGIYLSPFEANCNTQILFRFSNLHNKNNIVVDRRDVFNRYFDDYKNTLSEILFCDDVDALVRYSVSNVDFTSIKVVKFLPELDYHLNPIDFAARYGSLKCFKFLMLNKALITQKTLEMAIYSGNVEIVHLCKSSALYPKNIIKAALNQQNKKLILWSLSQFNVTFDNELVLESIASLNIRMSIYFLNKTPYKREFDLVAIETNNLAVLKYISPCIRGKNVTIGNKCCSHIVKYLIEETGAKINESSIADIAMLNDRPEIARAGIDYLGLRFQSEIFFKFAVRSNSFKFTRFLLENGVKPVPVEYKSKEMRDLVSKYQRNSD